MQNSIGNTVIVFILLSILLLLIITGLTEVGFILPVYLGTDNLLNISSRSLDIPETNNAAPGGYNRYRCKFWASHGCPNGVWVNNTPCANCVAIGR